MIGGHGRRPDPRLTDSGGAADIAGHDHWLVHGRQRPADSPTVLRHCRPQLRQPRLQCASANAHALFTPEGYYPLILKSLPLTPSISQGLQILDAQIKSTLTANPGDSVAILGYSQSADISSLEMIDLANPLLNPHPPSANQLGFTLLGDQMNPNGGFFARFPGFGGQPLSFPALGLTLYGATPSDTIYPTNIYTLEYDGWADFPRYPINLISDLNAELGIAFVHGTYPSLNPSALPPGYDLVTLPTSPGYNGVTNYYMITTPNGLPLLEPLRLIPGIGNPLADLLQPDLTTIVNLGYGNPNYGYSTAPADVQTYFGLFPHYSQALIAQDLLLGAHQGTVAFHSDIQTQTATSVANVSHQLATLGTTGGREAALHSLTLRSGGLVARQHHPGDPDGGHQLRQRDLQHCREPLRRSASDGRHHQYLGHRDAGLRR